LIVHKEKLDFIYQEKLHEEKRKLLKSSVDDIDRLMKENRTLMLN